MFAYSDPTAGTVLTATSAIDNYRTLVDRMYQIGINVGGSEFISIDELLASGRPITTVDVEWPAYPLSHSGVSDPVIDANRDRFQDEYVEWLVEKNTAGRVTGIKFTSLFPEYFHALAQTSEAALVQGIKEIIPGANPTTAELFGTSDPNQLNSAQKRLETIRRFWAFSPWNNGAKGILSLLQGDNTLGALTNLVGNCAVPRPSVQVGSVCSGPFCGRLRNSDPRVCKETQSAVRAGLAVTLADPIGIEIVRLEGDWELDGAAVDINATPSLWSVTLGAHRARLSVPDGLTLDGDNIITGSQISRKLIVKARVLAVDRSSLLVPPATPEGLFRSL